MWTNPDDEYVPEDDDSIDSETEQRLYAHIHHDHNTYDIDNSNHFHTNQSVNVASDSTRNSTGKIVRSDSPRNSINNELLTSVESATRLSSTNNKPRGIKRTAADDEDDYGDIGVSKYHVGKKFKSKASSADLKSTNEIVVIDDAANNFFDIKDTKTKIKKKSKKKKEIILVESSSDDDVVCLTDLKTDLSIHINSHSKTQDHRQYGNDEAEFSVAKLQDSMNDSNWDIEINDRYRHVRSRVRYYKEKVKCNNCNQPGHLSKNCDKPKKAIVCYLCGETGHRVFRCRNAMCSICLKTGHQAERCRETSNLSTKCDICLMFGHCSERCPDLWRRYHLTVSSGTIMKGPDMWNKNVQCYNCCSKNHFGHQCKQARMNFHNFPHHPGIFSYRQPFQNSNSSGRTEQRHNGFFNWKKIKNATAETFRNVKRSMLNVSKAYPNFPRNVNNFQTNERQFGDEGADLEMERKKKKKAKLNLIRNKKRKAKKRLLKKAMRVP